MSRILLNSELPYPYMHLGERINDYDFYLFHLLDGDPKYEEEAKREMDRTRAINSIGNNPRYMFLDNSAYEFYVQGEVLDLDKFAEAIKKYKPTHYFLPDVLMDKAQTLVNAQEFLYMHRNDSCPIGVVQGNSLQDFMDCLEAYHDMGLSSIAIPFHNKFFSTSIFQNNKAGTINQRLCDIYGEPMPTEDISYAIGRVMVVYWMAPYLKQFEHIHFLGSHCPAEVALLQNIVKDWKQLVTMDTAYPVKLAAVGEVLGKETQKPNIILDEILYKEDKEFEELLFKNLKIFHDWRTDGAPGLFSYKPTHE